MPEVLEVRCVRHPGNVLDALPWCEQCHAEREAQTQRWLAELGPGAGTVYYSPVTGIPEEVTVNGVPTPRYHGTAYVEWDNVPAILADEINAFIRTKLEAFHATCPCLECRRERTHG